MNMMSLNELEEAFGVFNSASSGLESAYASLEQQTKRLTDALHLERAESKRKEIERSRIARRLDCLIDVLPGAVLVLDGEGQIRQCNAAAEQVFGEDLDGKAWSSVSASCLKALRHGTEFAGPGGSRLSLASRSLSPDPGQVLLFTDVTESRAIDALSEQHGRLSAMGEMAASLAHQIRTPLASALLYASSAATPQASETQRFAMLRKLLPRLHDLERLISDMLLFARGAGPVDPCIAVAEVLHSAVATVTPCLSGRQNIEIVASPPELTIAGSAQALSGAVINLINNALDAAGKEARVQVSATRSGSAAVDIRVTDNGPGVAAGQEEVVFEPFFSGRSEGTGLGLAVVRSVARDHGGEAWAESGREQGACFVIRIPASVLGHSGEVAA